MDSALMDGQRNFVQRFYAGEGLADVGHLQQDFVFHIASSLPEFIRLHPCGVIEIDQRRLLRRSALSTMGYGKGAAAAESDSCPDYAVI
jgi:hypothetical protein